ncbi:hypothetical protein RYH80_04945 [Halobaculum sp. MBLA0147]|uniref:hypothetical protein n=1 Tax=Halobaculum sp. MBLA0147 TaxID=3079934 RepID=UPI0035252BAA
MSGCGANQPEPTPSPTESPTQTESTPTPTETPTDTKQPTETPTETETETPEPLPPEMQPLQNPVENPEKSHDPATEAYYAKAQLTQSYWEQLKSDHEYGTTEEVLVGGPADVTLEELPEQVQSETEKDFTDFFYQDILTEQEIQNIDTVRDLEQTVWDGMHRLTQDAGGMFNNHRTRLMKEVIQQSARYTDVDGMVENLGALNNPERDNTEATGPLLLSSMNLPSRDAYHTLFCELDGEDPDIMIGDHVVTGGTEPHFKRYPSDRISNDYTNRWTSADVGTVAGLFPEKFDPSEDAAQLRQSEFATGILYGSGMGLENGNGVLYLNDEEVGEKDDLEGADELRGAFLIQPDDPRSAVMYDSFLDNHSGGWVTSTEDIQQGYDFPGNYSRKAASVITGINERVHQDYQNGNLEDRDGGRGLDYTFSVNENGLQSVTQTNLTKEDFEELAVEDGEPHP